MPCDTREKIGRRSRAYVQPRERATPCDPCAAGSGPMQTVRESQTCQQFRQITCEHIAVTCRESNAKFRRLPNVDQTNEEPEMTLNRHATLLPPTVLRADGGTAHLDVVAASLADHACGCATWSPSGARRDARQTVKPQRARKGERSHNVHTARTIAGRSAAHSITCRFQASGHPR